MTFIQKKISYIRDQGNFCVIEKIYEKKNLYKKFVRKKKNKVLKTAILFEKYMIKNCYKSKVSKKIYIIYSSKAKNVYFSSSRVILFQFYIYNSTPRSYKLKLQGKCMREKDKNECVEIKIYSW